MWRGRVTSAGIIERRHHLDRHAWLLRSGESQRIENEKARQQTGAAIYWHSFLRFVFHGGINLWRSCQDQKIRPNRRGADGTGSAAKFSFAARQVARGWRVEFFGSRSPYPADLLALAAILQLRQGL